MAHALFVPRRIKRASLEAGRYGIPPILPEPGRALCPSSWKVSWAIKITVTHFCRMFRSPPNCQLNRVHKLRIPIPHEVPSRTRAKILSITWLYRNKIPLIHWRYKLQRGIFQSTQNQSVRFVYTAKKRADELNLQRIFSCINRWQCWRKGEDRAKRQAGPGTMHERPQLSELPNFAWNTKVFLTNIHYLEIASPIFAHKRLKMIPKVVKKIRFVPLHQPPVSTCYHTPGKSEIIRSACSLPSYDTSRITAEWFWSQTKKIWSTAVDERIQHLTSLIR